MIINKLCSAQNATIWTKQAAQKWFGEKAWLNGLKTAVHQPLDVTEFAKQYNANKAAWDKAIAFLRDRNLDLIPPGKYELDGENAYAIISEGSKDLDTAAWEAHRKYIDLHYVINGKEKIGINGVDILKVTRPYDEAKDVENYYTNGEFFTASPGKLFIIFPGKVHIANIKTGSDIEKKCIIKIKAAP